jgi:putative nucleotidyltransferase with HDIG domain
LRGRGLTLWLAVGSTVVAALVAAPFVTLVRSTGALSTVTEQHRVTNRIVDEAGGAQKALLDVETGLRAYVLTREPGFLDPFRAGRRDFAQRTPALLALTRREGASEYASAIEIDRQGWRYIAGYAEPLRDRVARGDLAHAAAVRQTRVGKAQMDHLRGLIGRFAEAEARASALRLERATTTVQSTRRIAIVGLLASTIVIAAFALALRRGIQVPLGRLRNGARQLAGGELGARVAVPDLRELHDVAAQFNTMAAALEAGHTALAHANASLEMRVSVRTRELERARLELLSRLARAAEFRDDDTHEHTARVGCIAALLARELGLPEADVQRLRVAAPLHDVGKIGVPDAILLKPAKLTPSEWTVMQQHALIGADLLAGSASDVLEEAARIARSHHERWDGTGYPDRLAGDSIPLAARIVAVADVFDALTHDRPYKTAWPIEDAVAEICRQSGHHFDSAVVDAFRRLVDRELLPTHHTAAASVVARAF